MTNDLHLLNDRWWDWRVDAWDGWSLRLIADNDLTYHHAVEVAFEDVRYVATSAEFSHPTFREPSADEWSTVRAALDGDVDGIQVFAWDTESATGFITSASVLVTEGHVSHGG